MTDIDFPLVENDNYATYFGTKFKYINKKFILISFENSNDVNEIEVTQKTGAIFYNFIQLLYSINSKLDCKYDFYQNTYHVVSFSKSDIKNNDEHSAIWFFFQKFQAKIQISLTFLPNSIQKFFENNKEYFENKFDLNEANFKLIMSLEKDSRINTKGYNRVFIYKSKKVINEWLNFQIVDSEHLNFILHYAKTIGLISQKPKEIDYRFNGKD